MVFHMVSEHKSRAEEFRSRQEEEFEVTAEAVIQDPKGNAVRGPRRSKFRGKYDFSE